MESHIFFHGKIAFGCSTNNLIPIIIINVTSSLSSQDAKNDVLYYCFSVIEVSNSFYICIYTCIYKYLYKYMRIYIYKYMHIYVFINMYLRICIYIYMNDVASATNSSRTSNSTSVVNNIENIINY